MRTLVCTVGGSSSPVVTAIRAYKPDRVVFVCSTDDGSGTKGSYTQVEGEGAVCKQRDGSALPNIPTQAGLAEGTYRVERVPADDPFQIADACRRVLADTLAEGAVRADYTGGTKSMSAGLFRAAVDVPGVELAIVSGPRTNLLKVEEGTEAQTLLDATPEQARWALTLAAQAWARYAYGEADHLLSALERPSPDAVRVRTLSRALAAWDAFDHTEAARLGKSFGRDLGPELSQALSLLTHDSPDARAEAARIHDLVLMGRRRGETGRPDTAVLIFYRALEWIAQWTLRRHHDVDTSDVGDATDAARKVAHLAHADRQGRKVLGLQAAWEAVRLLDGPLASTAAASEGWRIHLGRLRNGSLLAHGFTPLPQATYEDVRRELEARVLEPFYQAAFGRRAPHPQLPTRLPEA